MLTCAVTSSDSCCSRMPRQVSSAAPMSAALSACHHETSLWLMLLVRCCGLAACVARQSEAASSSLGPVESVASAAAGAHRIDEIAPAKEHAHIRALGLDDPIEHDERMSGQKDGKSRTEAESAPAPVPSKAVTVAPSGVKPPCDASKASRRSSNVNKNSRAAGSGHTRDGASSAAASTSSAEPIDLAPSREQMSARMQQLLAQSDLSATEKDIAIGWFNVWQKDRSNLRAWLRSFPTSPQQQQLNDELRRFVRGGLGEVQRQDVREWAEADAVETDFSDIDEDALLEQQISEQMERAMLTGEETATAWCLFKLISSMALARLCCRLEQMSTEACANELRRLLRDGKTALR